MPEPLNDKKIADFRKVICDVATRQFTEKGVEKVSMRSLAKELGYSATALYSYYKNKDEILDAAMTAAFERLAATMQKARNSSEAPLDQLTALASALLAFAKAEPAFYELMLAPQRPAQPASPDLKIAVERIRQILANCFQTIIHNQGRDIDPAFAAQAFWAAIHGGISLNMAGRLKLEGNSLENFLMQTTDLFRAWLIADDGEKRTPKPKSNQQFSLDL